MIRGRLLSGTLSNCVGKMTAVGLWFVLTPFVVRTLGPGGYALWVLIGAMSSYGLLLEHGIGGAVIKYVAEHVARGERDAARRIVASGFCLYGVLALVALFAALALAPVLPGLLDVEPAQHATASRVIRLAGLNVALVILVTPASSVLRGLQRYDLYNAVAVVNALVEVGAVALVLAGGGGLVGMMLAMATVTALTGVASFTLVARVAPDLRIGIRGANRAAARRIASFSASLLAIQVGTRLQNRADGFVIAAVATLGAVTPYALARKLSELSELVAIQFLKVIMPLASELNAGARGPQLRTLYLVSSRVALAIAAPVTAVLATLGAPILTAWVGAEYAAHAGLLGLLALTTLLATSQWPAIEILQGMARHRLVAVTWMTAGVANIVLSVLLLPRIGLAGVALGALIPTAISALCIVIPFAGRTLGVSAASAVWHVWMPALLPAAAAAVVGWRLEPYVPAGDLLGLAAAVAAVMATYAAAYLLMPATGPERRLVADLVSGGSRRVRQLPLFKAATS